MTLADPATQYTTKSEKTRTPLSEDAIALRVILVVIAALAAWGLAVFTWGLPGLYIPALALVPVVWVALLLISFGR